MAEQGTPDVSGTPFSIPAGNLSSTQLQSMLESFLAPIGEKMTSIDNTIRETKELTAEQLAELSSINSIISDIKEDIKTTEKNIQDIRDEFVTGKFAKSMTTAVSDGMKKSHKFISGLNSKASKTHIDKLGKNITDNLTKISASQSIPGADNILSAVDSLGNKIEKISATKQENTKSKDSIASLSFDFEEMKIESKDLIDKDVIGKIHKTRKSLVKLVAEGLDESKARSLNKELSSIVQNQINGTAQSINQLQSISSLQGKINNQQKYINNGSLIYKYNLSQVFGYFQKIASVVGTISTGSMMNAIMGTERVLQRSSVAMYGMVAAQGDIVKMLELQATRIQKISGGIVSNLQASKAQNLLFKQGVRDFAKQEEILKVSALSAQEMGISFEEIVEYAGEMSYDLKMSGKQTRFLVRGISDISKQFGLSAKQVKNIQSGMKETLRDIRNIRGASASTVDVLTRMRTAMEKERGNVKLIDDITSAFTGGIKKWSEKIGELGVTGSMVMQELRKMGSGSDTWLAGTTSANKLNKAIYNTTTALSDQIEKMFKSEIKIEDITNRMMLVHGMGISEILNTQRAAAEAMESTLEGSIGALDKYERKIQQIKNLEFLDQKTKNAQIAAIREKMSLLSSNISTGFSTALSDLESVLMDNSLGERKDIEVKMVLDEVGSTLTESIQHMLENTELIPKGMTVKGLESLSKDLQKSIASGEAADGLLENVYKVLQASSKQSDERAKDLNKTAIDNAKDAIAAGHNEATASLQLVVIDMLRSITGSLKIIAKWGSLFLGPLFMALNFVFGNGIYNVLKKWLVSFFQSMTGKGVISFIQFQWGVVKATFSKGIFGGITGIFGGIKGAFGGITKALGGLFGHIKFFAKFLRGIKALPIIGWAVAAVFAFVDFFSGWKNASEILGKSQEDLGITDKYYAAIASIVGGFVGIIDSVLGLFGIKTNIGGTVTKWLAKFLVTLNKWIWAPFKLLLGWVKTAWNAFVSGISGAFAPAMKGFKDAWDKLKTSFSVYGESIKKLGKSLLPILLVFVSPFYLLYKAIEFGVKLLVPVGKLLLFGLQVLGNTFGFLVSIPIIFAQIIIEMFTSFVSVVSWVIDKIARAVDFVRTGVFSSIETIFSPIISFFSWAAEKLAGTVDFAKRKIEGFLGKTLSGWLGLSSGGDDTEDTEAKKTIEEKAMQGAERVTREQNAVEDNSTRVKINPDQFAQLSREDQLKLIEKTLGKRTAERLAKRSERNDKSTSSVFDQSARTSVEDTFNKRIAERVAQEYDKSKSSVSNQEETRVGYRDRPGALPRIPGIGQSQFDTKGTSDDSVEVEKDNLSASQLAELHGIGSNSSETVRLLSLIERALSASTPNYSHKTIPGVSSSHKVSPAATFASTEGSYYQRDSSWHYNLANVNGGSSENMQT